MSADRELEALAAETLPECPYQGLEPFTESDRNYFFGREVDKERIGANLVTSPLTIFYGASGVGKTSVLLAGVLPFVRKQPDVTAIVFRSWQSPHFEQELKNELARAVAEKSEKVLDLEQTLDRCLDDAARLTGGTIVMVFDQFEEYMLYHAPSSAEGKSFDTAFARVVNRADTEANFLIGIREDALARLDRFRQYIPDLLSNRQQLVHLDERGAEEAIRMPLEHYNEVVRAKNTPQLAMEIEEALVTELIRQVRIGGGVGFGGTGSVAVAAVRVETPFMQMVLQKLWDAERKAKSSTMREKTLHDLGDAKKIVLDHVDDVMKSLTDAERAAAAFCFFDRLVTPSRSKIAYPLADLVAFAEEHGSAIESLVRRLSDPRARILREVAPAGDSTTVRYEIFHDVLSDAVLAWRAKHLRDVQEAKAREKRKAMAIVTALFVVLVFAAGWYIERRREAATAAETARAKEREELKSKALDYQAQLLQLMSERAQTMSTAGETAGDVKLLENALNVYEKLGDTNGQRKILAQIGALLDDRQDYDGALGVYDRALKLSGDEQSTQDLQARRLIAVAGNQAKQGEPTKAATVYLSAADLLAKNGDHAEQAQVLTSAAVAYQNANDLRNAEKQWRTALALQRKLNDVDGQAKSLAGIQSIEKQRRIALTPPPVTDTASVAPSQKPCTIESITGYWLEVDKKTPLEPPAFVWKFEVANLPDDPFGRAEALVRMVKAGRVLLHVKRINGTVSGDFVQVDDVFVGALEWVNGEGQKDVRIDTPSEQQNCGRLNTNQSFYFVRTKYRPAAAE